MESTPYVELARAESERGELVLRERRGDGAPSVLELRANGVFVMDTLETSTEQALASAALALVEEPRAVRGRRAGARVHDARGAARQPRRAVHGRRDRGGAGRLDARRHDPPRPGAAGRRAGDGRRRRRRGRARRGAAGVVRPGAARRRQRSGLPRPRGERRALPGAVPRHARRALRPGGVLVVWSADPAPELEDALREVFGNAEARPYDVLLQDRDEQYWLYSSPRARRARAQRPEVRPAAFEVEAAAPAGDRADQQQRDSDDRRARTPRPRGSRRAPAAGVAGACGSASTATGASIASSAG